MNPFSFKKRYKKNYFEGYYLRIVDEQNGFNKAFIFGMTSNVEDPHAFIHVVDGDQHSAQYYRYPIEDFEYNNDTVFIKNSFIRQDYVSIQTKDFYIEGAISNHIRLDKLYGSHSAMGIMHLLPMNTYQEIVFLDAHFEGTYKHTNTIHLCGKSYMEKTYGRKFPPHWIWIQSNHFDQELYLSCSIGDASMLNIPFKGFVISVWFHGKEYRYTTYNRAKLQIHQNDGVRITAKHKNSKVIITAKQVQPITLVGPIDKGLMVRDVFESITSEVEVSLYEKDKLLITTKGRHVGMENMYEN